MNRQIKFRGKPIDPYYDIDFVFGFYMEDLKDGEVVPYIFDEQIKAEVLPESVGQFSGLKDKNGTEIYEGDVVFIVFGILNTKEYFAVKFEEGSFIFYSDEQYVNLKFENCKEVEVCGTIHTTPELLTDKNK